MAEKILYVEDDETLGFVTTDTLQKEGFDICLCEDGEIAWRKFRNQAFDLCIIDVMLPKLDGFTLAEKIRIQNSQIPIIFVTAKSLKEDKIKGLTIGADDYITKPFSIEELVLKINVFLKRKFINDVEGKKLEKIGRLEFDFSNLTIFNPDNREEIKLTQREGELLKILTDNKNELNTRKHILERIWGREDYFLGRSMDVFISRLRKHLSVDPQIHIENIHGVGYRLRDATQPNEQQG